MISIGPLTITVEFSSSCFNSIVWSTYQIGILEICNHYWNLPCETIHYIDKQISAPCCWLDCQPFDDVYTKKKKTPFDDAGTGTLWHGCIVAWKNKFGLSKIKEISLVFVPFLLRRLFLSHGKKKIIFYHLSENLFRKIMKSLTYFYAFFQWKAITLNMKIFYYRKAVKLFLCFSAISWLHKRAQSLNCKNCSKEKRISFFSTAFSRMY